MLKRITFSLYAIVILVMAMATFIEKYKGSGYVSATVYGSWWFSLLWMLLAVSAVCYMVRRRVRRFSTLALHGAFLFILAGALLTHLTAWQGYIHLRTGESLSACMVEGDDGILSERDLPFEIRLDTFSIRYYNGTRAAADYTSHFTILTDNDEEQGMVSMNNIYSAGNMRLYQSGFDDDMQGTTLSINCDPWGIPVTYLGYALLFISWLLVLLNPKGEFRRILSTPTQGKASAVALVLLMACTPEASAATTLNREQADELGRLNVLYGDRICPLQTLALDFTRKLYGKTHYETYTAEQVMAGFMFYNDEWTKEPVIRVKSKAVQQRFGLPPYASMSMFFSKDTHQYLLGPSLQEYFMGNNDKLHQEVQKLDDKLMLIMQLNHYQLLKIFPYQGNWYAPTDKLPAGIEPGRQQYFADALQTLRSYYISGQADTAREMLKKIQKYQYTYGAGDIPSPRRLQAERLYNAVPFATILFMLCLTAGLLSLLRFRWIRVASLGVLVVAFLSLSLCLVLRWIISGYIPMSNGYETMLVMAWILMLTAMLACRRFPILLSLGLLLSGFLLLVSHLGQLDPKISNIMPVLSSPLLSIHVSTIMMAYALLTITAACSIYGLLPTKAKEMQQLSLLLLYPALFLLSAGIFIGAIWANVSWGRYWGWDPKEVWALITMLVYAMPLHRASFPWFREPRHFHLYMLLAFLSILMTYFGVNFFLGGMHSYA